MTLHRTINKMKFGPSQTITFDFMILLPVDVEGTQCTPCTSCIGIVAQILQININKVEKNEIDTYRQFLVMNREWRMVANNCASPFHKMNA